MTKRKLPDLIERLEREAKESAGALNFAALSEPKDIGKLTKPALVGNTRFGVGVSERMVIERAQREYVYRVTLKKEAKRRARVRKTIDELITLTKVQRRRLQEPKP